MDELPEFSKSVIEVLRQPLEEHQMRIARTHGNYVFPADFILIAAMNPCPCGCYPDMQKCTCTPVQIQNYLGRISQPFLDRIDLCVEAPRVEYDSLVEKKAQESSEAIRQRVCEVRNLQRMRYGGTKVNARLDSRETEEFCRLGEPENEVMKYMLRGSAVHGVTFIVCTSVFRTDGEAECGVYRGTSACHFH